MNVRDKVLSLLRYDPVTWQVAPDAVDAVLYQAEGFVDSLHIMSFIIALEEDFGIQLPTEITESDEFTSVAGVIAIVERLAANSDVTQSKES